MMSTRYKVRSLKVYTSLCILFRYFCEISNFWQNWNKNLDLIWRLGLIAFFTLKVHTVSYVCFSKDKKLKGNGRTVFNHVCTYISFVSTCQASHPLIICIYILSGWVAWQVKRQMKYANVIPKPERKQFKTVEQTLRTGVWVKVWTNILNYSV